MPKTNLALVLFFSLILGSLNPGSALADPSPEKARDIKKLLELSGIRDQLVYMKESLLNSYSLVVTGAYKNIPDGFWKEYNSLIGEKELDALVDQVVPVYDKHISHEAIKKLIVMFDTPFWTEWKDKMPLISREAGAIGSQWGQKLVQSEAFTQKMNELIKKYRLGEDQTAPSSDQNPADP